MAVGLVISDVGSGLKELDTTSSLNTFATCNECGRREKNKSDLEKHLQSCVISRTCSLCSVVYRNRGNLFSHIAQTHSENARKRAKLRPANYTCTVCPKVYTQLNNLKFHIRREHFNLTARISEGENRKVNEVWLERVLNCDAVVEMRKAKLNMFIIKKASENNTLKISEPETSIDLTMLYPTHFKKPRIWCDVCQKTYCQRDSDKHVREKHKNKEQLKCNNCNREFEGTNQHLQHICTMSK